VVAVAGPVNVESLAPGQVGGVVTDATGAVMPRVGVAVLHTGTGVTRRAFTDGSGRWVVGEVPSIDHDASRGSRLSVALQVGAVTETVEVMANTDVMRESLPGRLRRRPMRWTCRSGWWACCLLP
jgi:hypothetical protein